MVEGLPQRFSVPDGYRRDIDGLRAIAVVAVVAYHAGMPGVSGGFVGVDVFFVISGFLITGLLLRELGATGSISMADFYMRRIRRLAPALVVVLAAVLLLGAIYLTPVGGEQQGLAKSTIATLALASNLYFASTTGGYFDEAAEMQPLLHTWSLSVEEQFYLVWPAFLLFGARAALRRETDLVRRMTVALAAVFFFSLSLSIATTSLHAQFSFYSPFTRAWEFAAGGLVLLFVQETRVPVSLARALSWIGVGLVVYSVWAFDSGMPFPGYLALVPVLGAVAIIVGGERVPATLTNRILSSKPFVFVGLISYPLYLWHWPILVIARINAVDGIESWEAGGLCALATALAALTYRYVEQPVRYRRASWFASRASLRQAALIAMVALVTLSASLGAWAKYYWPKSGDNRSLQQAFARMDTPRLLRCNQSRPYSGRLVAEQDCAIASPSRSPAILVWGDSHAFHLQPAMATYGQRHELGIRLRYMAGCPPLRGYSPDGLNRNGAVGCPEFNEDVIAEISRLSRLHPVVVVLAARWSNYFDGPEADAAGIVALRKTAESLAAKDVRMVVVAPLPQFQTSVPRCLVRHGAMGCESRRSDNEHRRAAAMHALTNVVTVTNGAALVDFLPLFCDERSCPPMRDGEIMFYDDNHLSKAGSVATLSLLGPALDRASAGRTVGGDR